MSNRASGRRPSPEHSPAPQAAGQHARGIDVSQWQPAPFPWTAAREGGYTFACIRASVRVKPDPLYGIHRAQALEAGFLTGSYHYLYPEPAPERQAQAFARQYLDSDARDELPPMLDVEAPRLTAGHVRAFLDRFAELAREQCGIYTSRHKWLRLVGPGARWAGSLVLWVADWQPGALEPRLPDAWSEWTFWQTSSTGRLAGYPRPVDLDVYNGSVADLLARYSAGAGGPSAPRPATAGHHGAAPRGCPPLPEARP